MNDDFKTPVAFDVPEALRSLATPPKKVGDGTAKRRVLLVDDNVDSCELYQALLERVGHVVVIAHDGRGALALLQQQRFDVAIVDIGLPDIDGYEVARLARERLRERTPVLLAVTGYAAGSDRDEAARAGFDVYLTKPVDTTVLVATVGSGAQRSAGD